MLLLIGYGSSRTFHPGTFIDRNVCLLSLCLTIDYYLCGVPGHHQLFELMLRGGDGVLQSLHTFKHRTDENDSDPYQMPVLLHGEKLQADTVYLPNNSQNKHTSVRIRDEILRPIPE